MSQSLSCDREVNGVPLTSLTRGRRVKDGELYSTGVEQLVRSDTVIQPKDQGCQVYFWRLSGRGWTWSTEVRGVAHPYLESNGSKWWYELPDAVQHARAMHDSFLRGGRV